MSGGSPVASSPKSSAKSMTSPLAASKSPATATGAKEDSSSLKQTRRRLSVMSDNKLVEGIDAVTLDQEQDEVFNFKSE